MFRRTSWPWHSPGLRLTEGERALELVGAGVVKGVVLLGEAETGHWRGAPDSRDIVVPVQVDSLAADSLLEGREAGTIQRGPVLPPLTDLQNMR